MAIMYEDSLGPTRVSLVAKYLMAYPIALHAHLTGVNRDEEMKHVLGTNLMAEIIHSWNKPLDICNNLGLVIRGVPKTETFDARERLSMITMAHDLSRYLGACERIIQTPVPLSYARHTSRFLTLFIWSLPLCMVGLTGWYSVAVIGLMAWALFGEWVVMVVIWMDSRHRSPVIDLMIKV